MSERKPTTDPGREAWMLLYELIQEDRDKLSRIASDLGQPSAQLNLLRHLVPEAGAPMVSLAKALRCDDSNVTVLVDKLEESGLIVRRAQPGDRRVKLVVLTDQGHALRARLLERLSEPLPFIAAMTPKDKRALRDILRRATAASTKS
jgi:DNA-binding MarR family transcriptional regulator